MVVMWTKAALFGVIGVMAVCGTAQAGGGYWGAGHVAPHVSSCLSQGFFLHGSHLGLGSGSPGLHPHVGLNPCNWDRIIPCIGARPATVIVISSRRDRAHRKEKRRVARSDAATSSSESSSTYGNLVERARKLYPQGLPPIEAIWHPDGTVERIKER
jgi:hypothetical protein